MHICIFGDRRCPRRMASIIYLSIARLRPPCNRDRREPCFFSPKLIFSSLRSSPLTSTFLHCFHFISKIDTNQTSLSASQSHRTASYGCVRRAHAATTPARNAQACPARSAGAASGTTGSVHMRRGAEGEQRVARPPPPLLRWERQWQVARVRLLERLE